MKLVWLAVSVQYLPGLVPSFCGGCWICLLLLQPAICAYLCPSCCQMVVSQEGGFVPTSCVPFSWSAIDTLLHRLFNRRHWNFSAFLIYGQGCSQVKACELLSLGNSLRLLRAGSLMLRWKCKCMNKHTLNCDILRKKETNIAAEPDWYVAHLQLNKICSIITGQIYFGLHEEILLMNLLSTVYRPNKMFRLCCKVVLAHLFLLQSFELFTRFSTSWCKIS